MIGGIHGSSAILEKETLVAAIVGIARRGVTTDVGCDACNDQILDTLSVQKQIQLRLVEGTFARLHEKTCNSQN